jgi:hypothetical protein
MLIVIIHAGSPNLDKQLHDGVFHHIADAGGRSNRVALNQAFQDLCSFL